MKKIVYADNAATTKLDIDAFEAMKPYLLDEYGNASQPYSFARKPKVALKEARETIAKCINAEPDEIFFTSCGTESDNWAIKGTILGSKEKDKFITTKIEHHAVLNAGVDIESLGYRVKLLTPTKEGTVTVEELQRNISNDTGLVSVMFANNEIGTVQPIKDLCNEAHNHGALFHTDAVQATGHIKLDVKNLGVDMLSASAHKFNGPKGIGFLYVKKGTPIKSFISGGSQEFGMRAGTENVASIVGMAVALKKNCDEIEDNTKYVKSLEKSLIAGLNCIKTADYVRNGGSTTLPGNISLSFRNKSGEALLHRLDLRGISISTGSACDSKNTNISHTLKAIQLDESYANGTIRISLGKNNTFEDVKYIVEELEKAISNTK